MLTKNNIDWDFILDNMQQDKTILCIGSELFSTTNGTLDAHLRTCGCMTMVYLTSKERAI